VFQGVTCRAIPSPASPPDDNDIVIAVEAAQLRANELDSRGAVPGISAFGRVIAAGQQCLDLIDKKVVVGSFDPCGECDVCRRGSAAICGSARHRGVATRGTLAQRVTAQARWAVVVGDEVNLERPELAAAAGDAVVAYTLYARSNIAPRDPVIIVGASPIARFLVEILVAKGITPVVVTDPSAGAWTTWLQSKNAIVCRVASQSAVVGDDVRRSVNAAVTSSAPEGASSRAWRVISTSSDATALAIDLSNGPGTQLTMWIPRDEQSTIIEQLGRSQVQLINSWLQEASIVAVTNAHPDLIVEVVAMATKGEIDLIGGCNVVTVDRITALLADDATKALVVTVPPLS
jgi:D-arabinose 1-dehydrogenase-like Zn-dependent alcohol dehydrogenase